MIDQERRAILRARIIEVTGDGERDPAKRAQAQALAELFFDEITDTLDQLRRLANALEKIASRA